MSVTVQDKLLKEVDKSNIPNHVAVIMDGNGRWAKKIGKERFFGHNSGVNSVRETIDAAINLGVKNLTLYVFSMENWKRPDAEIKALMYLLFNSITDELENLNKNNIKLDVIGDQDLLTDKIRKKLVNANIQEFSKRIQQIFKH